MKETIPNNKVINRLLAIGLILLFSALTNNLISSNTMKQSYESITHWSFELHGGIVGNARLPLTIVQHGYPDIVIKRANYYSEPLISPWYWDWRFTKWYKNQGFFFEAIHHKIYLRNKPPEIQRFGISHGFNLCLLGYFKNIKTISCHVGIGSVLSHPESTIRNLKYPEGPGFDLYGYRLNGLVLNLAVGRRFYFGKRVLVNVEGKITAAHTRVPIVDGYAKVNNLAFHLILGPGINWAYSK